MDTPPARVLSGPGRRPDTASEPRFLGRAGKWWAALARSDFRFQFPFRIRYAETDAQGIVFNAHYLTFFDTAIYEYFRALPFDFVNYVERTGHDFHTVHVSLDFIRPARFDDQIEVFVKADKIGRSSLTFLLEIHLQGEDDPLIRGRVVWVNTDQQTRQSTPLPTDLIEKIPALEKPFCIS